MNSMVFFIALGLVSALSVWLGARSSRGIMELGEYLLAGRSLGALPLALSIMATQLGGGIVLGAAESAYRSGWLVLLWPCGLALGLLALGLGLGARLRRLGIQTIPELFATRYGSLRLRRVASILSVGALFFILVAQLIGLRKFLFGIGIESSSLYLLVGVLVVAYTALGGLRAVVRTDVIQTVFLCAVFALVTFVANGQVTFNVSWSDTTDAVSWNSWFLGPFLFMVIGQDMGQRCLAGRSRKSVSWAFIGASLGVGVIGVVPVALGVMARAAALDVSESSIVLLASATAFCSPALVALVAVAAVVALLSSIDSLICAVSSTLAVDLGMGRQVRTLKWLSFLVGGVALIGGRCFNDVGMVMMTTYEISISCLAVPVLMALVSQNTPKRAAISAMGAGAVGLVLVRLFPLPGELFSLTLSAAGYAVGRCVRTETTRGITPVDPVDFQ